MKKTTYVLIIVGAIIVAGGIYLIGFSNGEIEGEVNANPNQEFISGDEATKMEKCEATNLTKKENPRIEIKIGNIEQDIASMGNPKAIYTLNDFDNLAYGMVIKADKINKPLYTKTEICQGDKTISFTDLNLSKEEMKDGGSFGNMIQFNNMQADGRMEKTIKEVGKYTLYVYASDDGKNWYIAQEFSFEVR